MAEKKMVPAVRFAEFTDAWEQRKFSEITFLAGVKNKDNLPLESYSITNEDGFIPQDEKFENGGTMRDADKRMYYIVPPHSFAYNPARINVGSIGYQNLSKKVIVSSLYEVFQTTENIDDRFLWHWFKSPDFQKLIEQLQEGGVRLYFYYDKLCMGTLSFPCLEEQRRIGRYLDAIDHLITLHQRKCEKLKNIKKSMLEKMFPREGASVPEIRFAEFTDAWEQRKVGEFANVLSASRVHKDEWVTSGVPFYRSSDVVSAFKGNDNERAFISIELYKELVKVSGKLEKDDILITGGGSIGIPFIVPNSEPLYSKDADLIWIKRSEEHDSAYLYAYFASHLFREFIGSISHVGTIAHYTIEQVKDTPVRLPSIAEQRAIGSFFHHLDHLITLHQRKLEKLQSIKKSMLEKMFV